MHGKLVNILALLLVCGFECSEQLPHEPKILYLYGRPVNLTQESLSLNTRNIQNVSKLVGLKNLRLLDLSNNPIRDISPLQSLKLLEELDLRNTLVEDLKTIENNKNLKILNLIETPIKSLEGIPANIKVLYISNWAIPERVKAFRKKRPNCKIKYFDGGPSQPVIIGPRSHALTP